jgi:hypothetical protein
MLVHTRTPAFTGTRPEEKRVVVAEALRHRPKVGSTALSR